MSYQVIARKYRPHAFDAVVGQEAVARTLRNAIERGRVAHAYMFCGPRGVGKTSMARILAKALNCLTAAGPTVEPCGTCDLCERAARGEDMDVLEIDAASNRRVDDARTLISNVSFHPSRARFKVYIVDEVHMLTTEAFNALLKTLEEPPAHVKFIFATTDPQKVPATILSRCQRFDFRPVPTADISQLLAGICVKEGLEAEPEALAAIARAALGGVRDAESLLEQLGTLGAGKVRVEDLHSLLGTVPAERMRGLFDALASGDVGRTLEVAGEILDQGTDPGELLRQGMRHAHELMLVKAQGPRAADVEADEEGRKRLAAQTALFTDATLVYAVTVFSEALRNARQLGEGRLFAETALARLAGHRDMRFMDQLVRELQALEKRVGQPSHIPAPPTVGPSADASPTAGPAKSAAPRVGALPPGDRGASSAPVAPLASGGASEPRPGAAVSEDTPAVSSAGSAARDQRSTPARAESVGETWPEEADGAIREDHQSPADTPSQESTSVTFAASAGAAAPAATVEMVRARWAEVREHATRGNAMLRASIQSAEVADVAEGRVLLSFPATAAYHREKADEPASRDRIDAALASFFGPGLRVATIVANAAAASRVSEAGSAADVEGRRAQTPVERITAAEAAAVRESLISRLVERELGGQIVQMQREE
ncbi:MAG: DNA polymerase III subunit gamma/tau [Planctomycetes bacterium]|nr:DNA polymerase III subunit gamma/tau [Planctomycetota bacterium]